MKEPLILGVDPGLLIFGWALARGRRVIDHGSNKLPKYLDVDIVYAMTAEFSELVHQMLVGGVEPDGAAVERYVYQGKKRATNPAGVEVAELAREMANVCRNRAIVTMLIPRNDALRACVPGHRRGKVPSEKEANDMLERLYGVRLPNQHERDALMQCWAARQRWRAGR